MKCVCLAIALSVIVSLPTGLADAGRNTDGSRESPALRPVRERLRVQDFDGALRRLGEIKPTAEDASEAARLEAIARLGRAIQGDRMLEEGLERTRLADQFRKYVEGQKRAEAESGETWLFPEIHGHLDRYLKETAEVTTTWPGRFLSVLDDTEQASAASRRAADSSPARSSEQSDDLALQVWSDLYAYLCVRDAATALQALESCGAVPPERIADLRRAVPTGRE